MGGPVPYRQNHSFIMKRNKENEYCKHVRHKSNLISYSTNKFLFGHSNALGIGWVRLSWDVEVREKHLKSIYLESPKKGATMGPRNQQKNLLTNAKLLAISWWKFLFVFLFLAGVPQMSMSVYIYVFLLDRHNICFFVGWSWWWRRGVNLWWEQRSQLW